MKGNCGLVMGVLVLVAGVSFLLFGMKSLDGSTAHIIAGTALGLFGVSKIAHVKGVCPACK